MPVLRESYQPRLLADDHYISLDMAKAERTNKILQRAKAYLGKVKHKHLKGEI